MQKLKRQSSKSIIKSGLNLPFIPKASRNLNCPSDYVSKTQSTDIQISNTIKSKTVFVNKASTNKVSIHSKKTEEAVNKLKRLYLKNNSTNHLPVITNESESMQDLYLTTEYPQIRRRRSEAIAKIASNIYSLDFKTPTNQLKLDLKRTTTQTINYSKNSEKLKFFRKTQTYTRQNDIVLKKIIKLIKRKTINKEKKKKKQPYRKLTSHNEIAFTIGKNAKINESYFSSIGTSSSPERSVTNSDISDRSQEGVKLIEIIDEKKLEAEQRKLAFYIENSWIQKEMPSIAKIKQPTSYSIFTSFKDSFKEQDEVYDLCKERIQRIKHEILEQDFWEVSLVNLSQKNVKKYEDMRQHLIECLTVESEQLELNRSDEEQFALKNSFFTNSVESLKSRLKIRKSEKQNFYREYVKWMAVRIQLTNETLMKVKQPTIDMNGANFTPKKISDNLLAKHFVLCEQIRSLFKCDEKEKFRRQSFRFSPKLKKPLKNRLFNENEVNSIFTCFFYKQRAIMYSESSEYEEQSSEVVKKTKTRTRHFKSDSFKVIRR